MPREYGLLIRRPADDGTIIDVPTMIELDEQPAEGDKLTFEVTDVHDDPPVIYLQLVADGDRA